MIEAAVSEREQAQEAVERTVSELGRLDTLVNNAGVMLLGPAVDAPLEEWERMLSVNVAGLLYCAHAAVPHLLSAAADGTRRVADMVNISSVAGRVGTPMMGWYCASKSGLEAASNALRMEVEAFGVRVVLVEPGGFGTGIWDDGQRRLPRAQADGPYADAYRRANAGTGRLGALLPDPVWVARVVRVALGNPVPLPRYLVGLDAVGLVLSEKLAPTAVTDRVKAYAAGLRRLPLRGRPATAGTDA